MQEPFEDSERIDFNAEEYNHNANAVESAAEDRPLLFVDINLGED